jgi:hypothetical protein
MSIDFDARYDAGRGACREEVDRLRAENEGLRADAERLDYLDRLVARQQFISSSRPALMVGSDLHMGSGHCSLYIRDVLANVVNQGHADSVRGTIDAAMRKHSEPVQKEPAEE